VLGATWDQDYTNKITAHLIKHELFLAFLGLTLFISICCALYLRIVWPRDFKSEYHSIVLITAANEWNMLIESSPKNTSISYLSPIF